MAGSGTASLRGADALLEVRDLTVEFRSAKGQRVHAVSRLSFDLLPGETLGLVGESGCGKSSTALAVMRLLEPTAGAIAFEGTDLSTLSGRELRRMRRGFQMIFQDPASSVNPRRRVRDVVTEPLRLWGEGGRREWYAQADRMFEAVGMDPAAVGDRLPHQFSGGQLQRICIARALMVNPKLLIADEPVSALDVSVQAQILNLIEDLKERFNLTVIFVSHDLAVVKNVSSRVAVMYLGKLCEIGRASAIFDRPAHPYTRALLDSVPRVEPGAEPAAPPVSGDVPSPMDPPSGCRFRTRCPRADERCAREEPEVRPVGDDHFVACHHPLDLGPANAQQAS